MIQVKNLHYRYGDGTYALRGINLSIETGEFLLICGPNGSGKTTLLRLLSGLIEPSEGSILINGFDTKKDPLKARQSVGLLFQDPESQIVGETVQEDVAFGPENLGLSREEIDRRVFWALKKMGLEPLAGKPCYLLSGGEKRRLALAGVMAMQPDILLFDEPFANLDYPGVQEALRGMIQLHQEGHTLVVTTHEVEKVIAHVDRVVVLQGGRIQAIGPPENLAHDLSLFGVRPPCYILLGCERLSWLE
ncbi:MAG: energy-coupling factor ABC transporter ATP-binding protein [Desulfobacterota bacterium]|nr:energy-coupling factor ABC transporter ATP-binding protein [Thermodesulfobacteriota bacterium]